MYVPVFSLAEREANNLSFRAKFPPLPHPKAEERGEGNCIWKGTLAGTQSFGDVLHFMVKRSISVAASFSWAVGDLGSLLYWKKLQAYISWGNTITNRPGTAGDCSKFLSSEAALFCKRELSSQGEQVRRHGMGIRALSWDVSAPALLNMKALQSH